MCRSDYDDCGCCAWEQGDDAVPGLCPLVPQLLPGLDLATHITWEWVLQLLSCSFSNAVGPTPTQALIPRTIFLP